MTRKDYVLIASVIRALATDGGTVHLDDPADVEALASAFADVLFADKPATFDHVRFMAEATHYVAGSITR